MNCSDRGPVPSDGFRRSPINDGDRPIRPMSRSREEREYNNGDVRSSRSDRHSGARLSRNSGRGGSGVRVSGGSARGKVYDEDERPIKAMSRSIEEKEYGVRSSRSHRYDDARLSRESYSRGEQMCALLS